MIESNSQREKRLKLEYLWVFQWMCRVSLVFVLFLAIDFVLPATSSNERIVESYSFKSSRRAPASLRIVTDKGRKFTVDNNLLSAFAGLHETDQIDLDVSMILRMVLRVRSGDEYLGVSFHYSYLVCVSAILFVMSAWGTLAKDRVDVVYNLGSASLILLVIHLVIFLV